MPTLGSDNPVRFDGCVAVVTGGGRGLGREFVRLLAGRGASVVVNDVGDAFDAHRYGRDPGSARVAWAVAEEVADGGAKAVASVADISDEKGANAVVAEALEAFGRIDIIINSAGIIIDGGIEDLSGADLFAVLSVHLAGPFHLARAAWPHFRAQGHGRILNVGSSVGVLFGVPGHSAYDAAKGAVWGLTKSLAVEGEPFAIRVNALLPSASTRGSESVSRNYRRDIDKRPESVAPAACWLVSDECDVTGEVFAAGGGRMGAVYSVAGHGYQAPDPTEFSLEEVRHNWAAIKSRDPFVVPLSAAEWSEFRVCYYRRFVVPDSASR